MTGPAAPELRVGIGLIVRDGDGRLLLHRRLADNAWAPPSGNVAFGESLREAASRELREETGFRVTFGDPVALCDDPAYQMVPYGRARTVHFVTALFVATVPHRQVGAGAEASDWGWFAPDALPEPRLAYTDHWLDRSAPGKGRRPPVLIALARTGRPAPRQRPKLGVLAVVWRGDAVLLVKRRNEPQAGEWGFPGGHVEPGETLRTAAAREISEEAGVDALFTGMAALVELLAPPAHHYLLVAMTGRHRAGTAAAASDVSEAGWFDPGSLPAPLSENVARVVRVTAPAGSGTG